VVIVFWHWDQPNDSKIELCFVVSKIKLILNWKTTNPALCNDVCFIITLNIIHRLSLEEIHSSHVLNNIMLFESRSIFFKNIQFWFYRNIIQNSFAYSISDWIKFNQNLVIHSNFTNVIFHRWSNESNIFGFVKNIQKNCPVFQKNVVSNRFSLLSDSICNNSWNLPLHQTSFFTFYLIFNGCDNFLIYRKFIPIDLTESNRVSSRLLVASQFSASLWMEFICWSAFLVLCR